MGRRLFGSREVLASTDVQQYLMDQTVPRFPSAAVRANEYPNPQLNALSILDTTPGSIEYWTGAAWASTSRPGPWTAIPGATPYAAGQTQPQYRKRPDGDVELRGLIATVANNTTLGTLPVGHRPPLPLIFPTATDVNGGNRMDIAADGRIVRIYGSGAPSLDGIRFSTLA